MSHRTKSLASNALVAALYLVLTAVFSFMSFGAVQFRIAEMLNHLVVFQKKYFWGIVSGVILSNAVFMFSSGLGWYDLVFGVMHSVCSLGATMFSSKFLKNDTQRLVFNALSFGFFSFLIAIELNIVLALPFWFSYGTVALGEVIVMLVGVPIMKGLNSKINFADKI